jgi:hypothetical protein
LEDFQYHFEEGIIGALRRVVNLCLIDGVIVRPMLREVFGSLFGYYMYPID